MEKLSFSHFRDYEIANIVGVWGGRAGGECVCWTNKVTKGGTNDPCGEPDTLYEMICDD